MLGELAVPPRKLALGMNGAFHGLYRTGEIRQKIIARRIHHPAPVTQDMVAENVAIVSKRAHCRALVVLHQP